MGAAYNTKLEKIPKINTNGDTVLPNNINSPYLGRKVSEAGSKV